MNVFQDRRRRPMRPERIAALVLAVLLMLSAAGLTALAVAFTSQMPTIGAAR